MKGSKEIGQLIEEEYTTHLETDDDEIYWIKEALTKALNSLERKIWIAYMEKGTYKATAKSFHVSVPTLVKYLDGLRKKITEYVADNY